MSGAMVTVMAVRARLGAALFCAMLAGLPVGQVMASPDAGSLPSATVSPAQPLAVTAYAQLPFVEGARLSPDGQWVAGQFAINGEQRVVVVSPFIPGSLKQALLPADVEVKSLQWVGNENLLIRLSAIRSFGGPDRAYVTRVVAFNRVSGKFTKLLWDLGGQHAADVLWVPTDGSTKVLIAGQNSIYAGPDYWPAVYSVDVVTGRKTTDLAGRTDVLDWIADSAGVVRAAVATDRTRGVRSLIYRPTGSSGFQRKARADHDELEIPVLIRASEGATKGRTLVIRPAASGRDALMETDPENGEVLQTLFEAPEGSSIDGVRYDDAGNEVIGVYLGGNRVEPLHWLDAELNELQRAFEKSLSGRRARITTLSADRQKMLVRVDKPNEAGRLYFFDRADGSLRLFANLNAETNGAVAGAMKTVRYKARDGLEMEAIVTTPPARVAQNLPVVVMPHGGPWAHDTMDWDYWAQFVASRGYLVIQPNFRGSTGYGEEFLRKGEGQLGLAMQDDVNDALEWAVAQGLADRTRACIVGASYGGYAAMWGASRDPTMWRCAVSIAGVANLRREVNDFGSYFNGKRYREQWEKMTPDFAAVSPVNFVDRISAPVLLIHGKKDLTVDHVQSQSMYSRMKSAGKGVELVSLPQADHYFRRSEDRVALLTAIESFLAKHNPAD